MIDITRLVLTRKVHQAINIAGMVTVTPEEIRGPAVRIVVQAPRGVAVHRQEVYERIVADEGGGVRGPETMEHGGGEPSRLILTRKVHQAINIAGVVRVIVAGIRNRMVRIVVEAPRGIPVHRQEVYDRIVEADSGDGASGARAPSGPGAGRPPGLLGASAAIPLPDSCGAPSSRL